MKSIKLWLLLLLGFVTTTMFAQTEPKPVKPAEGDSETHYAPLDVDGSQSTNKSSLLWEISGNGLEQSSYLFGTIHIIAKDEYFWTDIMDEKFNATESLVMEINMENSMMMMFSMLGSVRMKKGTSLQDLLTEEEYEAVSDYFSDEMGMSISMFDRIKPMFTSMMIAEGGQAGMAETMSYEMELMEKAQKRDMKIDGLETVKYQMSMFDSIPYEDQAQMLVEAVKGDGEEGDNTMDEMVELYKKQDIDGLYELIMASDSDMEAFEDILLVTRNKNWIPKIEKMAKKKPTFFAVGAGHLPGKQGVINLLKAAGYTVKPIR
ncbi:MAG: TraB/GumN family protein [Saprospiraceae bacterium]